MGISVGLLTAGAVLLGRSRLPQLFSSDPAVIAAAATALPIVAFSMVRAACCSFHPSGPSPSCFGSRSRSLRANQLVSFGHALAVLCSYGLLHTFLLSFLLLLLLHGNNAPDALCLFWRCVQPLAPCALSLEGTVLGASQITWVGGRTILSAIAACSFFWLSSRQARTLLLPRILCCMLCWEDHQTACPSLAASSCMIRQPRWGFSGDATIVNAVNLTCMLDVLQGWQLPGIWAGMVLLVFCNGALDGALVLSKRSPIADAPGALEGAPAHDSKHAQH
jgi:hypothetical protein